jgi:hypothetical protein
VHWEDFFMTQDQGIEPIPFHPDPEIFDDSAVAALPPGTEPEVLVDGTASSDRYWRPMPGMVFVFTQRDPSQWAAAHDPDFVLQATVEPTENAVALRTNLPASPADCTALGLDDAPCDDADNDGLVDAWEDLVLNRLRPRIQFDESEPLVDDADSILFDVARVAPADDGNIRAAIMMGYRQDYGRCGLTAHSGDSERVVLNLALLPDDGPGDVAVIGTYTAAHEGTVTDHGLLLEGDALSTAEFPVDPATGEPRWQVYASDGKHATYHTVQLCEDAEVILCLDEDCAPDNVDDPERYDHLPPIINVGEETASLLDDLARIGFVDEDPWVDQVFCGGLGRDTECSASIRSKLLDDPF